jgi:hypothetical protein
MYQGNANVAASYDSSGGFVQWVAPRSSCAVQRGLRSLAKGAGGRRWRLALLTLPCHPAPPPPPPAPDISGRRYPNGVLALVITGSTGVGTLYSAEGTIERRWCQRQKDMRLSGGVELRLDDAWVVRLQPKVGGCGRRLPAGPVGRGRARWGGAWRGVPPRCLREGACPAGWVRLPHAAAQAGL